MEKLTLTVKETALLLNLGISKTYELARQNIIPNIRIGRQYIIPMQPLMEWLNKCKRYEGVFNER
jgi:excisionase family DNA binding protein